MPPSCAVNRIQFVEWEGVGDVVVITPVEHTPGFLLQLQSPLFREWLVGEVREGIDLGHILPGLLLEVWEEEEQLRKEVPHKVSNGNHQPEFVTNDPAERSRT